MLNGVSATSSRLDRFRWCDVYGFALSVFSQDVQVSRSHKISSIANKAKSTFLYAQSRHYPGPSPSCALE